MSGIEGVVGGPWGNETEEKRPGLGPDVLHLQRVLAQSAIPDGLTHPVDEQETTEV